MPYSNPLSVAAIAAAISCAISILSPSDVCAEPVGFRRPRITFAVGIDAFDTFTGKFGKAGRAGMSVYADAAMQLGGFWGAAIRFGSAKAMTDSDSLPYDSGYQFTYITASPRFNIAPFGRTPLTLFAEIDLTLRIMLGNTLVSITGNDSVSFDSGGSVGLQFITGMVSVSGQFHTGYDWNIGTVFISGGIAVGITGII